MLLYDTAAGTVRPLQTSGDAVSLYVCGITPYDASHLGHAFTYHSFDVLTRRLRAGGLRVRSVRNVTDVDDDIMRVSRERGIDWRTLRDEQVDRFDREMAAIDILPVDAAPRASDFVAPMVDWVARLEQLEFAYAREGWVYFDVSRFDRYGDLSRLSREQMIALSRERGGDPEDPRKDDPLDFVLWQPSRDDEPRWPSPWGNGRPGWHIECTVLSTEYLGATIDIHGGGDDLVYPHHESEIAQAEAVGTHPFARHWVHVAMVALDGTKMSKSLGNLVFVRDCLRTASPAAVRLLLCGQHYRRGWSYEEQLLNEARARAEHYQAALRTATQLDPAQAGDWEQAFFARLDDDLDTPGALHVTDEIAAAAALPAPRAQPQGVAAAALLTRLLAVLGVDPVAAHPLVEL